MMSFNGRDRSSTAPSPMGASILTQRSLLCLVICCTFFFILCMPVSVVGGGQYLTRITSPRDDLTCHLWDSHPDFLHGQCYRGTDVDYYTEDDQAFYLSEDEQWVYLVNYAPGLSCAPNKIKQIARVPIGTCGVIPDLRGQVTWEFFSRNYSVDLSPPWTGNFPDVFRNNSEWFEVTQFTSNTTHVPTATCESINTNNYTTFIKLGTCNGNFASYCMNDGDRNLLVSIDYHDANSCDYPIQAQFYYRTGCRNGALTHCPMNTTAIPSMPTLTIGYTQYTSDQSGTCDPSQALDEQLSMYWLGTGTCADTHQPIPGYGTQSIHAFCGVPYQSGTPFVSTQTYYYQGCGSSNAQSSASTHTVNTCTNNQIYSCSTLPPYAIAPTPISSTGTTDNGGSSTAGRVASSSSTGIQSSSAVLTHPINFSLIITIAVWTITLVQWRHN